jgi:uncharacterized membrane protein
MNFDEVIYGVVLIIELIGAAIMVVGAIAALVRSIPMAVNATTRPDTYPGLRRNIGRAILLGLEVLIVADIIRTILVDPTVESVLILGTIVVIRVLLSFALEVEIDGVWPWSRRRASTEERRQFTLD